MSAVALLEAVTVGEVDLEPFITALTGSITPAQLLTVLGAVIGVGMGFVLMYFGVRKAVRIFMAALHNGRISI